MGVLGTNQLDIKLDFDDVRFRGGCLGLGTAGMIVMNEHTDMVKALRNSVRFYSHESCGQCTPCREGTAWMTKILDRIVSGDGRAKDLEMLLELEKTVGMLPGITICGLADGASWAIRTFVNKFYDEFAARCPEAPAAPVTLKRGSLNVLVPMGSNTR
jgi:NADH-quinone oxidoreductase subunit F